MSNSHRVLRFGSCSDYLELKSTGIGVLLLTPHYVSPNPLANNESNVLRRWYDGSYGVSHEAVA
jgi:hypothetical protein